MSSEKIEAAAAEWFWKRDSGRWTADDEGRFEAWLNAATAHRIAYLRLRSGWKLAARMQALGAGVATGVIPERGSWGNVRFPGGTSSRAHPDSPGAAPSSARRSSLTRYGIAASAIVALAGALYLFDAAFLSGDRYSTPVGGLDTVPLADGSMITLNTDTRIRVALSANERRIELDKGEAFFDVAKDPARPFVVLVENKRITAVGTRFSVRRQGDDVRVTVTEGKVRVEQLAGDAPAAQYRADKVAGKVLLAAGSVAQTQDAEVRVRSGGGAEAEQLLSWRKGYVVFEATPLADAVAEFNRYNQRRIVIADPAIARVPIGGNFRSNNVDAFLWLLETGFPIEVERDGDEVVLKSRPREAPTVLQ